MPATVTCECGQITSRDDLVRQAERAESSTWICPECGRSLNHEAIREIDPAPKPGTFQQLWQQRLSEPDENESDSISRAAPTAPPNNSEVFKSRSLWEVMSPATAVDSQSNLQSATPPNDSSRDLAADVELAGESSKPKGLWAVMHSSGTTSELSDESLSPDSSALLSHSVVEPTPSHRAGTLPPSTQSETVAIVAAEGHPQVLGTSQSAPLSAITSARLFREPEILAQDRRWSARAATAFLVSLATVLSASCSLREGFGPRLPSLFIGVIGLLLGFTALSEIRRSRGRLMGRGLARSSVVVSAIGMFLAPLVFARWGDAWRKQAAQKVVSARLRIIGEGLEQFHSQQGRFPSAVLRGRTADGPRQPLHGWMTPLLPFIGHQALHQRIDLRQPFDAVGNVPAMQQVVDEFVIPGRSLVRSPRGMGLSHFAGVGGTAVRDGIGLVHLGAFNDDQSVRKNDIADGLSQTLMVGEISDNYPAWGEPGNVRSIGDGLNKQFKGFGNPSGTGATFLHGDGSVKFYSNKTDRRLLEQLETRDGGELIEPATR